MKEENLIDLTNDVKALTEEVAELRAQGEANRIRTRNLSDKYDRLQARYIRITLRLEALEQGNKLEDNKLAKTALTVSEAAEMMGVSKRTVFGYLSHGDLEAVKERGEWRIRPEDIKIFLETHSLRRRRPKKED